MKMPVQDITAEMRLDTSSSALRKTVAMGAVGSPAIRRRPVYISRRAIQPAINWTCLLEKAAACISECRVDIACYARCSPEAVDCFS